MALTCAMGSSVLLMAACGSDATRSSVAEAAPTSPTAMSPTATAPASPSPSLNKDQEHRRDLIAKTRVDWEKAATTAEKEVSGGKLVDLDLKTAPGGATASPETASPGTPSPGTGSPSPAPSPGAPQWEAEVAAADGTVHRIDIDAVTGDVFRSRTEPDQDADDKREVADRLRKVTQSPAQAVKTATEKTKGAVTGISLDEDDDRLVWSVDVVTTDKWDKTTYDVDATNGKIVREHVDRD
ncbi:PepSY domain-containing protein [Streptomyces sp. NPDC003393]